MFQITHNKGFHMKFANGYSISVQWGKGNYCENRHYGADLLEWDAPVPPSETAEVAVIDPQGKFVKLGDFDDVLGYKDTNDVAQLIAVWSRK